MKELILTKESAVYKLFNYPFKCRVPRYSTYSYKDLEIYGVYSLDHNEDNAYERIDRIMTIVEISKYSDKGIAIELVNPTDSGIIYEIIMGHLKMWRDYGKYFGHPYEPPLEDLYILDDLAKKLYRVVNNYSDLPRREEDLFDIIEGILPMTEEEYMIEYHHDDVMGEIQGLTDKLGVYMGYGY